MSGKLWDIFWLNRELLNIITKLSADTILSFAKTNGWYIHCITYFWPRFKAQCSCADSKLEYCNVDKLIDAMPSNDIFDQELV